MSRPLLHTLALASVVAVTFTSNALAHCFVGARFFPATLAIDDPCPEAFEYPVNVCVTPPTVSA